MYHKIKQGICGGPSIVYTRSMEKVQKLKGGDEICKNIFGFDANALYPYCLSQDMPCGTFVRRRESNLYKPEIQTKYLDMFVWMDKISEINNIRIMHRLNLGKEHYIMGYYVDGICGMNVVSYLGCYHHACQECMQIWKCNKSEEWVKQQQVKYDRTCTRREYLESLGYRVHEIWECQFKKMLDSNVDDIRQRYFPSYYNKHRHAVRKEGLLKATRTSELFGIVEVDIRVPDKWNDGDGGFISEMPPFEYFKEFSPVFCTTDVPSGVIGDHMLEYAIKENIPLTDRRLLVGGMKARKIMLSTPLLQSQSRARSNSFVRGHRIFTHRLL